MIRILPRPLLVFVFLLAAGSVGAQGADPAAPGVPNPPPQPEPQQAAVLAAAGRPLQGLTLKLAGIDEDERSRLQSYLADLRGEPITAELLTTAAERITRIRRYEKARCRSTETAMLLCDVWRARVLREVRVEGLPGALLETDLRKRVFLRPGEPLDDENETSGKSRLVRQRHRIEDFLEDEGFFGAEVRLLVKKINDRGERDVVIRVRGGSFVRVRRVDLQRFGPLSQKELRDSYGRMCWTSEGLLDGVFVGNLTSCFNKRRLQATTDRFTSDLQALGYPEARIRVEPLFVDPHSTNDRDCALSDDEVNRYEETGLKPPPLCVDLAVDVAPGTRVLARFHAEGEERKIVELPDLFGGTILWIRETFLESTSRGLQDISHAPPASASDTALVERRLREKLTFQEAQAVDETEIEVSTRNIEEYLASRGRVAPRVTVDDRTYGDERVIDFTAQPSPIAAVRSVVFVGNRSITDEEILDGAELAARPRSAGTAGTVSFSQLADDEERIQLLYAERGFAEASVQAKAELEGGGNIDVRFVIDEGERFVLSSLILAGGAPDLTPEVLAVLAHCQGGVAARDKRPALTGEDCRGAALRPDELDPDAQRVQAVYAGHGYPNVDATVETAFAPDGPSLRITVVPHEASAEERRDPKPGNVKQVRLGEVFLEGNRLTRRDVLLREAGLAGKAGEPLDPILLAKGISRLRRSGLYDSVELQYLGLDGSSDLAHVRLSVSERPAFTVDASVGFSTEQLMSLRTEVRHKNILGTMLDTSWLLDFGLFVGRFSQTRAQISWPRILGSDVSASFVPLAISYLDEPAGVRLDTPSTAAGQKASASWEVPDLRRRLFSTGASLGLDWRVHDIAPIIDDKLSLGVAVELRFDWLNTAAQPYSPFSEEAFQSLDGMLTALAEDPTRVATITPRIAYNTVDNPFDPTSGWGGELFLRGSPPGLVEHGPFGVVGASGRGYLTVFERLTLGVGGRTRIGLSGPVQCAEGPCQWALMQNDLLQLGGERSVRGVPENQIGVFGATYNQQLQQVLDEAGLPLASVRPGLYAGAINLEARFKLFRFFIGEVKPALFFDAGFSTDDFNINFAPGATDAVDLRYAWSAGAGVRWVLPVGPVSVDFGFSPNRGTNAFSLVFGYLF